jgi:hypothetical protein
VTANAHHRARIVTNCVSRDLIRAGRAPIGDRLCQLGRLQPTLFGTSGVARPLQ